MLYRKGGFMRKFIAKPNTWFDEGTEATLLFQYHPDCEAGLFLGIRNGKEDEEGCGFEEFNIIEVSYDEEGPYTNCMSDDLCKSIKVKLTEEDNE